MKGHLLILSLLALLFSACSGKVQTNPLPQEKKFHLPTNSSNSKVNVVSEKDKDDFDTFASEFFNKDKQDELNKSIYYIGIQRGHFQQEEK